MEIEKFKSEGNGKVPSFEVMHRDCLEALETVASNSVDAIITDPPYGSGGFHEATKIRSQVMGIKKHRLDEIDWFPSDNMTTVGMRWLMRELCLRLDRVMNPDTSLLMFTDWRMVPNLVPVIESCGFMYRNLIVWNKKSSGQGYGFRPQHEIIMQFVKGAAKFHSGSVGNVITCKRTNPNTRVHHTQKPVELLGELIKVVTKPGDTILDPFAGSSSTGEAAIKMGRNFVGIEKAGTHYLTSVERLQKVQEKMQGSMFDVGEFYPEDEDKNEEE